MSSPYDFEAGYDKRSIALGYLEGRHGMKSGTAMLALFDSVPADILALLGPDRAFREAVLRAPGAEGVAQSKDELFAFLISFLKPQTMDLIKAHFDGDLAGRMTMGDWLVNFSTVAGGSTRSWAQVAGTPHSSQAPAAESSSRHVSASQLSGRRERVHPANYLDAIAKELQESETHIILFHATTEASAAAIDRNGILLSQCANRSEFASRGAFYTSTSLDFVLRWAFSRFLESIRVLVFVVPKTFLSQQRVANFETATKAWKLFCHANFHMTGGDEHITTTANDIVYGPICAFRTSPHQSADVLRPYTLPSRRGGTIIACQYGVVKQNVVTQFEQFWSETWTPTAP
ncbi:hypothetical protein BDZ88DRAFT_428879 [Geranomyces variabilis]|nr:hypothetical protein BDZ88DRAFT_428879 [Geranomyces variabilis]KAJ3138529.1 hypothetical protein HDU90_000970 [Geranomyces variabilis]